MQLSKGNLSKLPTQSQNIQKKQLQNKVHQEARKSDGNFNTTGFSSRYGETNVNFNNTKAIQNSYNQTTVLNNKTIKYISNQDPIEIQPSEIIFKDIQVNQTYEITVYVRNLTKTARRIRVFQPTTTKFRADYEMQGAIAAGLAMKVIVTFETSLLEDFHDVMKIVSDTDFERDIQLHAYAPSAQIIFEPFINLGFIKMGKTKKDLLFFKNEGKQPAKVELVTSENTDLKLDPNFFSIQPNQEYSVNLAYTPQDAGIFRGLIEVKTDGQTLQNTIDVNATSVEFTRFVIDENGSQANQFDFQTFYFGQTKQIQGYLVNNTPKRYRFNIKFRKKLLFSLDDIASLQTPQEVGKELTEKVMSAEPSEGIIDSYSQIPVTFFCCVKVIPDHQIEARMYAISKNPTPIYKHVSDEPYSAIVEFEGDKSDPTILHIIGRGIAPQIKLSDTILQFGECNVYDHKEIMFSIENKHKDVPIDITLPRVPYFHITPSQVEIEPSSIANFVASFQPKQIGHFSTQLDIGLVKNNYQVPIKLLGIAKEMNQKTIIKRGPETIPEDFEQEKQYVDQEHLFKEKNNMDSQDFTKVPKWIQETDDDFKRSYDNKKNYDQFLRQQREIRLRKEVEKEIASKYAQMSEKLKYKEISEKVNQEEDEDGPAIPPRDNEFEVGMINTRLTSNLLQLPEAKDKLFVTKPIADYEPYNAEDEVKKFEPDPNYMPKKPMLTFDQPNHVQQRDISKKLDGKQLQKIFAGPNELNFGQVYVKSTMQKVFQLRNDLRTNISVRLIVDCQELQQSYQEMQIIPPSQHAYIPIKLCSQNLGPFKQNIKYVINEKHFFEIQIVASIELVKLELSKTSTKMQFSDEKNDMVVQEKIRITNNGNAEGHFKWYGGEKSMFTMTPDSGKVPPAGYSELRGEGKQLIAGFLDCILTYRPNQITGENKQQMQQIQQQNQQNQQQPTSNYSAQRIEEDKLTMKVQDGIEMTLKCQGVTQEPKTYLKSGNLEFKQICICKPEQRVVQIKNNSRIPAVFSIDESKLPPCTEVHPKSGGIGPDYTKDLFVKFLSKEEQNIKGDVVVLIRGGRTIKIPLSAEVIIPEVEILEEKFNFGNITTLGNPAQLKMTLVNNSKIPADLVLDLRGYDDNPDAPDGIDCIDIFPDLQAEESLMHSVHPDQDDNEGSDMNFQENNNNLNQNQNQNQNENPDDFEEMGDSEESEDEQLETKKSKLYNLTIKEQQTLIFTIKMSPKEPKNYKFLVPLTLARYEGYLDSMEKTIECKGLKPKFLIEPQVCQFSRKIIIQEKWYPSRKEITFHNPDKKPVKWRLDTSNLQNENKIFVLKPTSGVVEPRDQQVIEAQFNPYVPDNYEVTVPLYIDDPDLSQDTAYMDIVLKGEGAFPRLLFDRKEVILPVVPLNVSAKSVFRIINDGYENLNLKYKIIQDISPINVDLVFIEGKTLGITRNKIKVEATFSHNKPLSFTSRIEFYDDTGRIYSICVSGTTDNCLFTNFAYMQRCQGEYSLHLDEESNGPIILKEEDDDIMSVDGENARAKKSRGAPSVISNKTFSSHTSNKSVRTALGYTPIHNSFLEQNVEFICRWLNFNVLTSNIHSFPGSVIESNGLQIFELVSFVTGRQVLPYKQSFEGQLKRLDKVNKLFKQYDDFIRALKTEGAMLNHIRPEFLLSYTDFCTYIKQLPSEIIDTMTQGALRIPSNRFQYLSIDSWTTIFYQIIKIYYLARVNAKTFKSIPGIPPEKSQLPDYLEQSNVFSANEVIVLYWLELHYEQIHPLQLKRIKNFDDEFKDGQLIASVVQSYVGTNQDLQTLKNNCQNEQDLSFNAGKVIKSLSKIGLTTHLVIKDLIKASQREMLLFNLQLLHALPHYIPKAAPIIFQCVLGEEVIKNIELSNPTNKQISYYVNLEAHPDFTLESDETVMIDPKSTYKVRIKFTSRISDSVSGRITFTNKKESNISAAALVFDLKSQITGRKSQKRWDCESRLYETFEFNINIKNLFTTAEYADFNIQIVPQKYVKPEEKKKGIAKKKKKGKEEQEEIFPAFFCKDSIRIKKGQSQPLNITFIPLTLETQKCYIIFKDNNVGELQHEIEGKVSLPNPMETFIFPQTHGSNKTQPIFVDEPQSIEFQIPQYNQDMHKARRAIEHLLLDKYREKARRDRALSQQGPPKVNFPGGVQENVLYDLELQPATSFVIAPQQFTVINHAKAKEKIKQENKEKEKEKNEKDKKSLKDPKKNLLDTSMDRKSEAPSEVSVVQQQQQQSSLNLQVNKIPLNISFKNPVKDLKMLLTMRNQQKTDIRIYRLQITAFPKPVKATLEFRVPSRNVTTQNIPIINNTDREWNVRVSLTQDTAKNGQLFTYPNNMNKEFKVAKKSTGYFPLSFSPKWLCQVEGKLELLNVQTNDKFEYILKGYGEEPVAEDHIVIDCKARETTTQEIELKNPYTDKEITYQVETDLINSTGPKSITIKPNRKAKYILSVTPVLSGQYTGSISFFESENQYIWYTVLLNTESPKSQQVQDLNTTIRQSVVFEIDLANPLKQPVNFEVIINGEGLQGENSMYIQPESSSVYELMFSPLFIGRQTGRIAFINEQLGEIWYDLNLNSEEPSPVRLPVLKTELGKVESHTVTLTNPLDKEVKLITKVLNQTNFDVIPDRIILKPYEQLPVQIRYMPSNLDLTESGEVHFLSQEIGNWKFLCFGIGISPTPFQPRIVSVGLNKDYSSTIHFKNPFKETITISISLEAEAENAEVFKLLTKQKKGENSTKLQVPGMNVIQIPFSFVPREINCYDSIVVVSMNDKIEWRYPLRGVTESVSNVIQYHFKTQCRTKLEEEIKINLQGIVQLQGLDDNFVHEMDIPKEHEALVRKFFQVTRLNAQLSDANEPLEFAVNFQPLKPFKTTIDFNILRKAGGRWKFRMIIEATEPKEDDLIVISSPLHKTTSVSFKLTNKSKGYAGFVSQFTPDSDPEFTIMPKTGELEPYGREGTTFIISFTPIEYGKTRRGKLIIQTEDMYWSYLVKGVLPKYNPPQALNSALDDRLSPHLTMALNQTVNKNYMIDNIKQSKQSPTSKKHNKSKKDGSPESRIISQSQLNQFNKSQTQDYSRRKF